MAGENVSQKLRRCSRCKAMKRVEEFGPAPKTHDGLHGWCRPCKTEDQRERYARKSSEYRASAKFRRENNREKFLEKERRASARRRLDPEFLKKNRTNASERNRTRHVAAARVTTCRICGVRYCPIFGRLSGVRTCSKDCSEELARRLRSRKHAIRRARKKSVPTESVDPFFVFERDGWRCYLCGVQTPPKERGTKSMTAPELEHIVPLSRGGSHTYDNVACACRRCNAAKGSLLQSELDPAHPWNQ